MAFSSSGIYVYSIMAMMKATAFTGASPLNPVTSSQWKIALHSNSLTQGTAPINFSATSVKWANTNEVADAVWVAGGRPFTTAAAASTDVTPTLTEGTAGALRYDHTADVSVAATTLSNARGCIVYCDSCTGPTGPPDYSDLMLVAVTFGSDYSTNNGTFGIQWSGTGIFEIDLTP